MEYFEEDDNDIVNPSQASNTDGLGEMDRYFEEIQLDPFRYIYSIPVWSLSHTELPLLYFSF